MQGVCGEHRIDGAGGPNGLTNVQDRRRAQIGASFHAHAGGQVRQIAQLFSGMPGKVRQVACEMHRMLARAAADLEHLGPLGKAYAQHRENRLLVAFAGIRYR